MTLYNPTTDPPKWSLDQRKMFEALVNDFTQICLTGNDTKSVRQEIKDTYKIKSTYDLTQTQLQEVITFLLTTIQFKQPEYNLKTTKQY